MKATVHLTCQKIISSQGASGNPKRAPRELLRSSLGAKMEFGEAQKRSPQAPESLENDFQIKSFDFQETQ